MRIAIDLCLANDPSSHRWLDRILHKVEDGWHVWDAGAESDPEDFHTTEWIRDPGRQGRRVREMLVAAVKRGAWSLGPHGRQIRVTTRRMSADDLTPEEAAHLAEEPLTILVENRRSDGAFVERIAKELDKGICSLWHKPGGPVRFDSVGGTGQMLAEVQRRAEGGRVRPRLVVVIDSDKKTPHATPSRVAQKLHRQCERLGVPCWVLAKRESENYLPRILLSEKEDVAADHHHKVEAWDSLSEDQKDVFDMKSGLPDDLSVTEAEVFRGLSSRTRAFLAQGFGGKVYKCWQYWHVQARTDIVSRGRGDLERGIALIRKEV